MKILLWIIAIIFIVGLLTLTGVFVLFVVVPKVAEAGLGPREIVMLLPLVHAPEWTASFPWRYLLILGIVHTGIMYQLLYSAIQKLPTPVTGSLSFIYPLVAMVVDYLVFHHALSAVQLLGGMLILFAAAGNNLGWGEKKPRRGGVSEQSRAS